MTSPDQTSPKDGQPYAGDVTPAEAWEALSKDPNAVLVDVRTQAEWSFVGVPDLSAISKETVFVEWSTFPQGQRNEAFIADLQQAGITPEAGKNIYFLCRSGQRSIGAATAATAAGLGRSYNIVQGFEGGLDDSGHRGSEGWRASGLAWRQS